MNKLLGIRLALIVFFLILLGLATHLLFSYLGTACDTQTDDRNHAFKYLHDDAPFFRL